MQELKEGHGALEREKLVDRNNILQIRLAFIISLKNVSLLTL